MTTYLRTTHDENGIHRPVSEESRQHWHAIGHLTDSTTPKTLAEIVAEASRYNQLYPDAPMEVNSNAIQSQLDDMAAHGFVRQVN